jgi:hypothetical protein
VAQGSVFEKPIGHYRQVVTVDSPNPTGTDINLSLFACLGQTRWGLERERKRDRTRLGATRND